MESKFNQTKLERDNLSRRIVTLNKRFYEERNITNTTFQRLQEKIKEIEDRIDQASQNAYNHEQQKEDASKHDGLPSVPLNTEKGQGTQPIFG